MNEKAKNLLIDIEKLKEDRETISQAIEEAHKNLSDVKVEIINEFNYLIGREADCELQNKFGQIKHMRCKCTRLVLNDDYETVTPQFSFNGERVSALSYNWIN